MPARTNAMEEAIPLRGLMKAGILTVAALMMPSDIGAGVTISATGPGAGPGSTIIPNESITFNVHLHNDADTTLVGITHGIRLYSPENAAWTIPTYDTAGGLDMYFDLLVLTNGYSVDGTNDDTIALSAASLANCLPMDYNDVVLTITTQVDDSHIGKKLCLDSSWFPLNGLWIWQLSGSDTTTPSWGGPYCYDIVESAACPDLRVHHFTLAEPPAVFPGEAVGPRLELVVENVGDTANDTNYVAFYLSEDTVITSTDSLLLTGVEVIPIVQPNDTSGISINPAMSISVGYPVGPANLGVVVDNWDQVTECDESNNTAFIPVDVLQCPDKDLMVKILNILNADGDPVPNKEFTVYRVANDPPAMTQTLLGYYTTNDVGRIVACLRVGDSIKVQRQIYVQDALIHPDYLPTTLAKVYVDNASFSESSGAVSYNEINAAIAQTIQLDHTEVAFDLAVSIQWDASPEYLDGVAEGLRHVSNFLYDVFDGQVRLGEVHIYDNRVRWERADMRIYLANDITPSAAMDGHFCAWATTGYACAGRSIEVPPKVFWHSALYSVYGTSHEHPLDMTEATDFKVKVHELGHYLFGFGDEYEDADGHRVSHTPVYGVMEDDYDLDRGTELSRSVVEYACPLGQNTQHWHFRHMGCADWFQDRFGGIGETGLSAYITLPTEYTLQGYLTGPNDDLSNLDYDVGALMNITIWPQEHGATEPLMQTRVGSCTGASVYHCPVTMCTDFRPWEGVVSCINAGRSCPEGLIRLRGFYPSRGMVFAERRSTFVCPKGGGGRNTTDQKGWLVSSGQPVDSAGILLLDMEPIVGYYPYTHSIDPSGDDLEFSLYATNLPTDTPYILVVSDDTDYVSTYPLTLNGTRYHALVANVPGRSGWIILNAYDSVNTEYAVMNPFVVLTTIETDTVFYGSGPGGSCRLSLDSANGSGRSLTILSTQYTPVRDGISAPALQGGDAISWCFHDGAPLYGTNRLGIFYYDPDLGDSIAATQLAPTLRIYRWHAAICRWELVGGCVDTVYKSVTATITETGVYAAFTTGNCCNHDDLRGDADYSMGLDVGDLTFLVAYLFQSGDTPPCLEEGDVDGSSGIDVGDLTWLVAYLFQGGPDPAACP
ncbi:MAG: hypothetical protein ABII79_11440 [bacterium]